MKNRKQLPAFRILNRKFDLDAILSHCRDYDLFDYSKFNDIKKSADSHYKNFLIGNGQAKNSFFIADHEMPLEGEMYKQLYLTGLKLPDSGLELVESNLSIKTRYRRIQSSSKEYIPELDEHNFGKPNEHYIGAFKDLLDSFCSPLTRVRLAVLMPGMIIKKHRDLDPSIICRYHIPLVSNDQVEFGMEVNGQDKLFNMPADGSIYFFNSGLPHWVSNRGTEPRLHLIVDTNGQLDLDT
jgi:hypothetical protein